MARSPHLLKRKCGFIAPGRCLDPLTRSYVPTEDHGSRRPRCSLTFLDYEGGAADIS
jgi:hypothetical protein